MSCHFVDGIIFTLSNTNDSYRDNFIFDAVDQSVSLALMDDFFTTFNVDRGSFSITTYYPPEPPLKHLLNPFRKNDIPQVADFTIGMLIASARAGRWLYD
ncbi:hypothetical protein B5022_09560 [Salmonella enterica subsp. enterica serovar Dublin]|uniref:DUF1493 family protein n=2 Tax=Salmonella dublin TaxID=98360 RepID=M7RDA1_SALDU|nr:hypothetical protein BWD35_12040 [Salmonella enterica subsp. enterica serovar Dublin str. ATCC 39184]EGE29683.1 hypothetical protein SD3246_1738 [Salmonella enterica subsp. enterica serovar Dublin str. SD3246]EMR51394.1 hypothetical protein A670_03372 [Salmonella enterica subsp. enterica serovar Dublin str. UC16]EPI62573.1 hypothetical protein A671_05517 [Salmonella enterica subsp. enterica serovar Dublin str. DG22]KNN61589.1 acyl carrier protein [Salmonella enterica subsp. enterica serovar 